MKIICLCGSTKFKPLFKDAETYFKSLGYVVLSCECFSHYEGIELSEKIKNKLDELHMKKIEIADVVLVINPGGYIGESTRKEIMYAKKLDKRIIFKYQAAFLEDSGEENIKIFILDMMKKCNLEESLILQPVLNKIFDMENKVKGD